MRNNRVFIAFLIYFLILNNASSLPFSFEFKMPEVASTSFGGIVDQSLNSKDQVVSANDENSIFVSKEYEGKMGTPFYSTISNYSVIVPPSGDPTDIYYPSDQDSTIGNEIFPFVLLLQGANVDKSFYRGFASTVASYGFIVVVPNHKSISGSGLFAEERELNDVLAFMISENSTPSSPIYGKVDTDTMLLLGHSYGGAAGLYAIQGTCRLPFCFGLKFNRPSSLKGGAFYGTNLKGPIGSIPVLKNDGIPIALIQGTMDGLANPAEGRETFRKIEDPLKAYIAVEGANHYGITDMNNPPGAKPDPNDPLIAQEESVLAIGRWSALFLRAYILGDRNALDNISFT
jgi:hypothetical protein